MQWYHLKRFGTSSGSLLYESEIFRKHLDSSIVGAAREGFPTVCMKKYAWLRRSKQHYTYTFIQPGSTNSEVIEMLQQRRLMRKPLRVPQEVWDNVILKCFQYSALLRPTFNELFDILALNLRDNEVGRVQIYGWIIHGSTVSFSTYHGSQHNIKIYFLGNSLFSIASAYPSVRPSVRPPVR